MPDVGLNFTCARFAERLIKVQASMEPAMDTPLSAPQSSPSKVEVSGLPACTLPSHLARG